MVNPKDWEQGTECTGGSLFAPTPHPVIEWADRNPDKIAGMDRRHDAAEYIETIRNFAAKHGAAKAKADKVR
jgi:hypothetical protein